MSTTTLISPFSDFQTLPSNLSGQCQFSQYEYLTTAGLIFIIPFATCTAFSNIMKSSISRQMGLPGPFITAATQHILTGIWTINQWQSIFTTSYQMSQWALPPKKKLTEVWNAPQSTNKCWSDVTHHTLHSNSQSFCLNDNVEYIQVSSVGLRPSWQHI